MRDKYSPSRISELHPNLNIRNVFVKFIEECESEFNITIRIVEPVFRSVDEQNKLYAQGRTTPGDIVTNAKGGTSYHNFGLAIDIAVLNKDEKTLNSNYDNSKFKHIADKYCLEWGGDWVHIKDRPHYELRIGFKEDCSDLRLLQKDSKGYPVLPTKNTDLIKHL